MAKFATNNNNSASIGFSLFFALKVLHLFISFDVVDLLNITTGEQINKKKIIDILEFMQLI